MSLNFSSPVNSLGYGHVGLSLLKAFEVNGEQPTLWPIGGVDVSPADIPLVQYAVRRQESFDATAPSLRLFHQFDLAQHVGRGPKWAFPIFELDRFKSNELHHLNQQDGLIVASEWAKDVITRCMIEAYACSPPPIVVAPLGVDHELFSPAKETPKGTPTRFLNIGKWEYRKGHDVLCKAFNLAFEPDDNVELVMHCHNPCFQDRAQLVAYNTEWEQLYKSSKMGDKVYVSTGRFKSHAEVATLMANADCGVFPSRAEGWNLEASEMLAMGKWLIITGYSAHTQFCNDKNAMLIPSMRPGYLDIEIEDAHDGIWFNADDVRWGDAPGGWLKFDHYQVDSLVWQMRFVHELKQQRVLGVNTAGIESMKSLTWESTASTISKAMECR